MLQNINSDLDKNSDTDADQLFKDIESQIIEGDYEAAMETIARTNKDPNLSSESARWLAIIAIRTNNFAYAIDLLKEFEETNETTGDAIEVLATLYALVGKIQEALYFGKLATLNTPDGKMFKYLPSNFPTFAYAFNNLKDRPLLTEGISKSQAGDYKSAILQLEQHLSLFSDDIEAITAISETYIANGDFTKAVNHLRVLRSISPNDPKVASNMAQAMLGCGEFDAAAACHREAIRLTGGDELEKRIDVLCQAGKDTNVLPTGFQDFSEHISAGLAAALAEEEPFEFEDEPDGAAKKKITVAYIVGSNLSEDGRAAAVRVFAGHDRTKVRVIGIGIGTIDAARNKAFKTNCDWWINAQNIDHFTLATILRGENVDVLVDLSGLGCVEGVLLQHLRCAGFQISAPLGVAVLDGMSGVDLSAADLRAQDHVLNTLFYTFEPAAQIKSAKANADAATAVTLGADLDLRDLNWHIVGLWSQILKENIDSKLLLSGASFENPTVVEKLIDMFGTFGVVDRIEILSPETSDDFLTEVDVLLSPFPGARPYVVAAAISAGVPVVVMDTQSDTANVVRALGLADTMIATDDADYVAKASAAIAQGVLSAEKIAEIRKNPLFNPKIKISEIENFYIKSLEK